MVRQRVPGTATAVLGVAEAFPFPPLSFDRAIATTTGHHRKSLERGLDEMRRVAARQVVLLCEP